MGSIGWPQQQLPFGMNHPAHPRHTAQGMPVSKRLTLFALEDGQDAHCGDAGAGRHRAAQAAVHKAHHGARQVAGGYILGPLLCVGKGMAGEVAECSTTTCIPHKLCNSVSMQPPTTQP